MKRGVSLVPLAVAGFITFRAKKASASSTRVPISTYRERIEQLNRLDKVCIADKYKEELTKAFGYPHVVASLNLDAIDDLHFILTVYSKPLSPEQRIRLRNKFLSYIENTEGDTQRFFEDLLTYYEVL